MGVKTKTCNKNKRILREYIDKMDIPLWNQMNIPQKETLIHHNIGDSLFPLVVGLRKENK